MYKKEKELLKHYNKNINYSSENPKASWPLLEKHTDINQSTRILDLGCGDGRWSRYLHSRYGCKVYGVNFSSKRIDRARELSDKKIRYWSQDAYTFIENYNFKQWGKFDYVLMVEFLEHLEDPERVLKRLSKIAHNIVGTVPLNFPYVAHLQVFKTEEEFASRFPEWDIKTFVKDNKNIHFYTK